MTDEGDRSEHYRLTKQLFRQSALHKQGFYDAKPGQPPRHTVWQLRVRRTVLSFVDVLLRDAPGILRVIDVGCGRGDFTIELARRYPSIREIWGTDFSPEALAIAAGEAGQPGRIFFREADLREMPFEDNRFDLTVCINVLHHIHRDDLDRALAELARITRGDLVLEIKNRRNPYYRFIRSRPTDTGKEVRVFPTSVAEVTRALGPRGFRLTRKGGIMLGGWLSPLLVLAYEKGR